MTDKKFGLKRETYVVSKKYFNSLCTRTDKKKDWLIENSTVHTFKLPTPCTIENSKSVLSCTKSVPLGHKNRDF